MNVQGQGVRCANCGRFLSRSGAPPLNPVQPRYCAEAPCRTAYQKWRFHHDPAYRERNRQSVRRRRARGGK